VTITQFEKITQLRHLMKQHNIDAYLIPQSDKYQNEYPPPCYRRLEWLTSFTGSAGFAIVTDDQAVVMSDGRYTIQLENEVDQGLYALGNSQETTMQAWLNNNAKGKIVGFDPQLYSVQHIKTLKQHDIDLSPIDGNLIDAIWVDRPDIPAMPVSLFPENYAGQSAADKIHAIQGYLRDHNHDAMLVTSLDSIAWLLNIRGNDIDYVPVSLSYLLLPQKGKAQWFIDLDKISQPVHNALSHYVDFFELGDIRSVLGELGEHPGKLAIDPASCPYAFDQLARLSGINVTPQSDPIILKRACKNNIEQNAMRQAHMRDGVALVRFMKWLEHSDVNALDELKIEEKLEGFRAQAPEFKEPSFNTIAGFASHGAIVHYRATSQSNKNLSNGHLLLLDSGAQYCDGTTDVTRTFAIGTPTNEMIKHYTLVLKGHIAVSKAIFDTDTTGKEIDALARAPLQEHGLDYAHGTGHGVGCYLSVHEQATSISPREEKTFHPGMIISNEPGYYKTGAYGIRIENLVIVQNYDADQLLFETITLAPYERTLIDIDLLTMDEKDWINAYHQKVFDSLSPLLDDDHVAWLQQKTAPIK